MPYTRSKCENKRKIIEIYEIIKDAPTKLET